MSSGTSYRLRATTDQLDLLAFRQLAADARAAAAAGEPGAACDAYEQALGLWRGEPAADVDALRGQPAAVQLSQARAAAVLEYAQLADQAGRAERVLGHLAELAAREPLNEKACARLMLTLAALASKRQRCTPTSDCGCGSMSSSACCPAPSWPGPTCGCSASRSRRPHPARTVLAAARIPRTARRRVTAPPCPRGGRVR